MKPCDTDIVCGDCRMENEIYLSGMRRDRVFNSLALTRQQELTERCVRYGKTKAGELALRCGEEITFESLAGVSKSCGVAIHRIKTKYALPFLAEYIPRRKRIDLYVDRISETEALLRTVRPEYFERYTLMDLCLAHEMFHVLEHREFGTVDKIISEKIGPGFLRVRHYFPDASEVAAHSFVKELLGLNFSTYGFADELRRIYENRKEERRQGKNEFSV